MPLQSKFTIKAEDFDLNIELDFWGISNPLMLK